MHILQRSLFGVALLYLLVPCFASANTTTLSTDPSYASGPFVFFCDPYTSTFQSGQSYQPDNGAECAFSLSNTIAGRKIINIYKGVPGNATLVAGDLAIGFGTLEGEDNVQFGSPAQGADYFAAEYDFNAISTLDTYLQTGGDLPTGAILNQNYYILPWKWGSTVVQPPLTVTADNKVMTAGGTVPALTATLSGFTGGDTASSSDVTGSPSCTTSATSASVPGNYPITCTGGSLSSTKYTFTTFIAGTLTVNRAPLAVTATNKTMTLGASVPALTATLSGFVGGDTATSSGVTGTPSCTTSATSASPVGSYPITCTIGTLTSGKYTFATFVAGILTITYRWDGFLQPINDTAHEISCHNSSLSVSVFKAGSTVPVKLQLKNVNGIVVKAAVAPIWLTPEKGAPMNAPIDESLYTDPASSGNVFTFDGSKYNYNWSTKGLQAGYWYKISAKLDDGTIVSVIIGLR